MAPTSATGCKTSQSSSVVCAASACSCFTTQPLLLCYPCCPAPPLHPTVLSGIPVPSLPASIMLGRKQHGGGTVTPPCSPSPLQVPRRGHQRARPVPVQRAARRGQPRSAGVATHIANQVLRGGCTAITGRHHGFHHGQAWHLCLHPVEDPHMWLPWCAPHRCSRS
jgi:hypothetical protein